MKINQTGGENDIKKKLIIVIIIVFFIILMISSYFLLREFLEYKKVKSQSISLIENVIKEDKNESKIDFQKLEKINEDIIGWIEIENTNINYPILKDDSNLKYIKHSYDGSYSASGSIFTIANKPFEDSITTIYGHNMKTGLMFSDLSKYMNYDFLEDHKIINIYTKNMNYKATIFSVYSINVFEEENNLKNLNFEEEIKYYENASKYEIENFEKSKKILKLSTCSYLNNRTVPTTQRYFIVAYLQ